MILKYIADNIRIAFMYEFCYFPNSINNEISAARFAISSPRYVLNIRTNPATSQFIPYTTGFLGLGGKIDNGSLLMLFFFIQSITLKQVSIERKVRSGIQNVVEKFLELLSNMLQNKFVISIQK